MKFLLNRQNTDRLPPLIWKIRGSLAVAVVASLPGLAVGAGGAERFKPLFKDALDAPAIMTARAPKIETMGVVQAGKALVAVGARGAILRSENGGDSWVQVASPVSTDLVSVFFVGENKGWAVGHDAVILHTQDGGRTWVRQLDGRDVNRLLLASYERIKVDYPDYVTTAGASLQRIAPTSQSALPLPFLDVWFTNEAQGFVVGAFNLIFHTADGGKTWEPWDHLTDNPKIYHLNAVRGTPTGLFIVGERGLVLRWNEASRRFVSLNTGYRGSFFGVYGDDQRLVVYGLRGNVRLSHDGSKTWSEVKLNAVGNVVKVGTTGSDQLLYVLQDGTVMKQDATGALHEVKVAEKRSGEVAGALLLGGNKLLTTGIRGPVVSVLSDMTQQMSTK